MLYDFDKPVNRRNTHSMKWDVGYSIVPEEWYQAYMDWWKRRHGFSMEKDWLIFCTGVVPAISSIQENKRFAEDFLQKEVPQIKPVSSQATYLMWLDCQNMQGCATELVCFVCIVFGK